MNYNIKILSEPVTIIKSYFGEVEVDGTTLKFYIDEYDSEELVVEFDDEDLLQETLLEHEVAELMQKIKNEFKRI